MTKEVGKRFPFSRFFFNFAILSCNSPIRFCTGSYMFQPWSYGCCTSRKSFGNVHFSIKEKVPKFSLLCFQSRGILSNFPLSSKRAFWLPFLFQRSGRWNFVNWTKIDTNISKFNVAVKFAFWLFVRPILARNCSYIFRNAYWILSLVVVECLRPILEYLSGSVQICTDSHRNVCFKTLTRRRVYLVEHFLFKYFQFQNCFLTG